ncbi:MAG: hypothetical protein GEV08_15170 [Acidimicrobiia bacterium]|nr:hypothetical protein [Acidimicrobiia bacterium]
MSDRDDDRPDEYRPSQTDQIRIVGAESAGDLTGERPGDEGPDETGAPPREVLRFPRPRSVFESIPDAPPSFLDEYDQDDGGEDDLTRVGGLEEADDPSDPDRFGRVPVIRVDQPDASEELELPHWTQPPTGQVPRVIAGSEREDDDSWTSYGSSPRWRDPSSEWDAESYGDVADLGDDLPREGALDDGERPALSDFFAFDDLSEEASPTRRGGAAAGQARAVQASNPPRQDQPSSGPVHRGDARGGRDVPVAVGVGVTIAVVALVALRVGPAATLGLVTLIIGLGTAELLSSARRGGHHPAVLLGLAASAGLPLAAYWRGVEAFPLMLFLVVVAGLLWYVFGVDGERPASNLGITLLAVGYVGGLGSFAALILRLPGGIGTDVLLAAIIPTVAADVFAFVVGRNAGKSQLSPISPNKTVEGLLGGVAGAVICSVLFNDILLGLAPFDTLRNAFLLGVVVAVVAPLGDLSESLLKRDFGVKDMGTLFPAHGGVLDRFDTMLFVLPATYYLGLLLDLYP